MLRDWQNKNEMIIPVEPDEKDIIQAEPENIDELCEPVSKETENSHGGDEATKDIEESENNADEGEQEKDEQESEGEAGEGEQESEGESETGEGENGEGGEDEESDNENEGEGNNDDDETNDGDGENENDEFGEIQHKSLLEKNISYKKKRLANALAIVIQKIAEDLAGYDTEGEDVWDTDELMKRRFSGKNIYNCKKSQDKEKIILALDFSGSCDWLAKFFLDICRNTYKLNDVVLLDASNGFDEKNFVIKMTKEGRFFISDYYIPFENLKNRTVIFFGDFDGGASVVNLSKSAKVFWFCNEKRYVDLYQHSWCDGYGLNDFRGKIFKCFSENDFLKLIKKVR